MQANDYGGAKYVISYFTRR